MWLMSVTLDVSKLSAWLNAVAVCRVERRACDAGRGIRPGRALGGGDESGMHEVGPTQGCGARGTRGAHVEHGAHVRDLGRVEPERLVELRRALPRVERRGYDAKRHARGWPESRLGDQGTRNIWWARTRNIWCMVVTLVVLKLSGWLNVFASCRVRKRLLMGRERFKTVGVRARAERT